MNTKLFLIVTFSVFLFSCGGNDSENNSDKNRMDTLPPMDSGTANTTKNFFYSMPSPLAMAAVYKTSKLKYNEALVNSPDRVSKYSQQRSMALNMGVYNADLAYCLVNDQKQMSLKYIESIKILSDGLKMSSVFDTENYLKRFRDNVGSIDSLKTISAELKGEADLFLYDNQRQNTALFIFVGVWSESMYLATQSLKSVTNNIVATSVAEQKYALDNLMNLMNDYQKEPNFVDLFLALNNVKEVMDKMVTQGDNEEAKVEINQRDMKDLTEKVASLRNKIISE